MKSRIRHTIGYIFLITIFIFNAFWIGILTESTFWWGLLGEICFIFFWLLIYLGGYMIWDFLKWCFKK